MRTLLLILALAMITPPTMALADPAPQTPQRRCATAAPTLVAQGKAELKRLGDLPPANHMLALWRQVDGCPTPVVLREGIGGTWPTPRR
jgi:hypothetical protein